MGVESTFNPSEPLAANLGKPAKNNKALLWCLGILAVVGVAAAAVFAVLYFTGQDTDTTPIAPAESSETEITDEPVANVESDSFSNEIAQNLIDPYIKSFFYNHNVLDFEFDDNAKVEIAYLNVSPALMLAMSTTDGSAKFKIDYYSLNEKYQQLFGSSTGLAKQNFATDHTNNMEYDTSTDSFIVENIGSGGTAMTMFSIVKDATYDGETIKVEVYHDQIPLCDANPNNGYCYNANDLPLTAQSSVIQDFNNQIPVYTMTFVKDNSRFVLSSIQK